MNLSLKWTGLIIEIIPNREEIGQNERTEIQSQSAFLMCLKYK